MRNYALMYEYNMYGVFIQGISGELYTVDEWSNQETANGVAVITERNSFVIAKQNYINMAFGSGPEIVPNAFYSEDENIAKTDKYGVLNTRYLVNSGVMYPAASGANDYEFPNGSSGYLPALGELMIVSENYDAVQSALSAIGSGFGNNNAYWSSTQYDLSYAWAAVPATGSVSEYPKSTECYIRPFTTL